MTGKGKRLRAAILPLALDNLQALLPSLLFLGFVGRLGDPVYIAGFALSTLYANITCLFVIQGLAAAVGQ